MSSSILNKTITLRQLLITITSLLIIVFVIWGYLGFKHAYIWYTIGPGLHGSPFTNFPDKCKYQVLVHEGQGNMHESDGGRAFFFFHNRTFTGPVESLVDHHECAGWQILTGLHIGQHANYRIIYRDKSGRDVVTLNVDYNEPYIPGTKK